MVDLINATRGSYEFYLHSGLAGAQPRNENPTKRMGPTCYRGKGSEFYAQCRHTHREPEVVFAEDVLIPYPSIRIIQVTKYSENP